MLNYHPFHVTWNIPLFKQWILQETCIRDYTAPKFLSWRPGSHEGCNMNQVRMAWYFCWEAEETQHAEDFWMLRQDSLMLSKHKSPEKTIIYPFHYNTFWVSMTFRLFPVWWDIRTRSAERKHGVNLTQVPILPIKRLVSYQPQDLCVFGWWIPAAGFLSCSIVARPTPINWDNGFGHM